MEYWDEISEDIEKSIKEHDPSAAYQAIRRLKGEKINHDNVQIQNKQGGLLTKPEDMMGVGQ
ncbi:unnamed protein product, partial [Rotaria sp. Silwood2]